MKRILYKQTVDLRGIVKGTPGWSKPGTTLDRVAKLRRNGWKR